MFLKLKSNRNKSFGLSNLKTSSITVRVLKHAKLRELHLKLTGSPNVFET